MATALEKLRQAVARRQNDEGGAVTRKDNALVEAEPLAFKPLVRRQDFRQSAMSFRTYRYVLILFAFAVLYFGLMASDRYATVSQVYVKSTAGSPVSLPQAAFLNFSSPERQDAALIRDYIYSRDMFEKLEEAMNLSAHYKNHDWDFFSRLSSGASNEKLLAYYRKKIGMGGGGGEAGVLSLEVQAFTPEFSLALSQKILALSEEYINKVSQDIALEETQFVRREVEHARAELDRIDEKLAAFQHEHQILDVEASGLALQGVVNNLEGEISSAKAEEKTLSSFLHDGASELVTIRARIRALETQLAQERAKISAKGGKTVGDIAFQFRQLKLEQQLATDLYTSVLASAEKVRVEAFRKLKHLVVVQTPRLPDEARYPRRLYNLASFFVIINLIYGMGAMIMATIREHRDV